MNKKLLLTLFLLIIFIFTGCSRDESMTYINIYGNIMDNLNRNIPVANAVVSIGNISTYTDYNGNFILSVPGNRTTTIKIEKTGYWPEEKNINLGSESLYLGTQYLKTTQNQARVTGKISIENILLKNNLQTLSKEKFTQIPLKRNEINEELEYIDGEVLVKFRDNFNQAKMIQSNNQQVTMQSLSNRQNIFKIKSKGKVSTEELYNYYSNMENVEKISYNYIGYLMSEPNTSSYFPYDPLLYYQWHYNNINIFPAWDKNTGSRSVTVAVIDTGYIPHIDLDRNIDKYYEWDFTGNDNYPYDDDAYYKDDENSLVTHGTHVAGIIGAIGDNGSGVAGINWEIKIMPLRIFEVQGERQFFTTERLINAIYHAVDNGASVINLSLAYVTTQWGSNPNNKEYILVEEALAYAYHSGVTVVAAAGNSNENYPFYPASSSYTIAVGATDYNDELTYYTNYGDGIDIYAPGGNLETDFNKDTYGDGILSTHGFFPGDNQYYFMVGTSMAAPQVAGVAALMVAQGIRNPYEIKDIITGTATPLAFSSTGLLNAARALGETPDYNFYLDVKVFAAHLEDGYYHLLSNITGPDYRGYYDLANVKPGKDLEIIAWIDSNGDNIINDGDLWGVSKTLYLRENEQRNNVNLTLSKLSSLGNGIFVEFAEENF